MAHSQNVLIGLAVAVFMLHIASLPVVAQRAHLEFGVPIQQAGSLVAQPLEWKRPDTTNVPDPVSSGLLIMPTGRTLPAGSGMIGLAAPYIPYGAISVAENWQISAGGVYVFTSPIGDAGEEYYSYVILKHTLFEDGGSSIAVGGTVMFWGREVLGGPEPGWRRATIPGGFAVATLGSEESALTIGLGFANVVGGFGIGFEDGFMPGIGLGYETYLSPDWKLMTEHFSAVLSRGTLHTVGVRYFFAKAALDLGMVIIPNGDVNISGTRFPLALPFVGISVQL